MEEEIIDKNLILEQRESEGFCGYTLKKIIRKKAPDRCVRCGAKNEVGDAVISEGVTLVRSEAILHCGNIYIYTLENSHPPSEIRNYAIAEFGFKGAKEEAYKFALRRANDIAEKEGLTLNNLVG